MSNSFPEDLNCLTILGRFLKEHFTTTETVVFNSCSELLLNLCTIVFTDPENAHPKQVLVNAETDPRSVQHPFSQKLNHQTSLALIPASGNCSYHMLITFIDIFDKMVEKRYRHFQMITFTVPQPHYMATFIFKQSTAAVIISDIKIVLASPLYQEESVDFMKNTFSRNFRNHELKTFIKM